MRGGKQGKGRPSQQRSDKSSRIGAEIGYGKPPRSHQFKPGQSGNPKGRPKGAKSTATLVRQILDSKISTRTSDGRVRKVMVREAMITRFADTALKGDTKAASFLFGLYEHAQTEAPQNVPTQEDTEILKAFLEKHSRGTQ